MKKILAWPAPLLQKWLLSLLLCLPFLAATIVSAFSGDRTFLILSALLLLFCGVRCAELYVMLANERYCAEEGICLSVSGIPFQRQRRVILQKEDGKPIGSICRFPQFQVKSRPHTCRSHVHWQSRKLNPLLSIARNRQTKPLGFLKLLSTCFR